MDKVAARKLVKDTFERPFDKPRFTYFTKNLFQSLDQSRAFTYAGNTVPKAYQDYIGSMERIGQYVDSDDKKIDTLVVRLKKETSLERARTMQRNFIAWYLNGSRDYKDAALVAFLSPEETDWRFSLVKMEYNLDDKGKPKAELTPARRWSFLVGAQENSHTAQSQLEKVLESQNKPSLTTLEEAFNVEIVTREFFNQYRDLYHRVKKELDNLVDRNDFVRREFEAKHVDTVSFAKKLLGQIVFLYFLQKKGWLGVPPNKNWGDGDKRFLRNLFAKAITQGRNFFNSYLEYLFYEALARQDRGTADPSYYPGLQCKIPFLNGGLFDPINDYDWEHVDLTLPNDLFSNRLNEEDEGTGILDIFDLYNFTVREDEPLEKEVAIDPEMLGKVFENLLEGEDRKSKGTYYTPREIVHYMCQESLINYLDTSLNIAEAALAKTPAQQGKLIGTPAPVQSAMKTAEKRVRVPREDIEFLVCKAELALQNDEHTQEHGETETYTFKLPQSIRENATLIDEKLSAIRVCDPAIGSGAFPVGMMTEIVRARGALTPFLPKDSRSNYSFKRDAIQNCLYGVDIDPGAVEIAKLRLWLSLVVDEENINHIEPLPNLDYKIVRGNSLLGLKRGLENWRLLDEVEKLKSLHFKEFHPDKKQEYRKQIEALINQLAADNPNFDFRVYFSEVFHEKGGFDVVIANPPYIRQEQLKDLKQELQKNFQCYEGTADIYVYFYERGRQILRENGTLTFISSNKYFRAGYGAKLRAYLSKNCQVGQVIDFGDAPVFEAIAYPSIIVLKNRRPEENEVNVFTWQPGPPLAEFATVVGNGSTRMPQKELTSDGWRLESPVALRLLEKLRRAGKPLSEYVDGRFYRGIITGLNEAFVVDRAKRDRLIAEDPSSAEILKPFLRGKDVKRWTTTFAEQYLIMIESSENQQHPWSGKKATEAERIFANTYPAIHERFQGYRQKLIDRDDKGTYFWELRSCKYWKEFELPKIAYPNICKRNEFAWDDKGYYINQKAFIIPGASKYLFGVLNSTVITWLFDKLLAKLQGGFYEPSAIFMKDFPIPVTTKPEAIEAPVNKILSAKAKDPKADVSDLEHKIDQLVYQLYGLTPEEIVVVEGKTQDGAKSESEGLDNQDFYSQVSSSCGGA